MNKISVMLITVSLMLVMLTGCGTVKNVTNEDFSKAVTMDSKGTLVLNAKSLSSPKEQDIISEMHEITNNYVLADKYYGKKMMTQERVNGLIIDVLSIKADDSITTRAKLIAILKDWKDGNFTHLDTDHNYLWCELGGVVGRATDIKTAEDLPAWNNPKIDLL